MQRCLRMMATAPQAGGLSNPALRLCSGAARQQALVLDGLLGPALRLCSGAAWQ